MFILRFPQLAVSAKLLCLLMVICGTVPSMVRCVELSSSYGGKYVQINDQGRVFTAVKEPKDEKYTNLTIISIDFTKLSIYSPETRRYICFNKNWRLKGVIQTRRKNPREMARCQFREGINARGFSTFQSIADETQFLAFDKNGRVARKQNPYYKVYQEFLKRGTDFDIIKHNTVVGKMDQWRVPNKTRHNHGRKRD